MKLERVIPYARQSITDQDIAAVVETLKSDYLTQGPKVLEFENKFAEYVGAKYAVAVANGTAALHLSAIAVGINEGDKILSMPISFVATTNGPLFCGATVEFVDINLENYLIDLSLLKKKLESRDYGYYKALFAVDFAGHPLNLSEVTSLCKKHGVLFVEDACHAFGAKFEGAICGGCHADLSVFSFHPVKHLATGEGGMITTNNKDYYDKMMLFRTHGITRDPKLLTVKNEGPWYYEMHELGYNFRMTDIQAALGISQLKSAIEGVERRREIAERYQKAFKSHPSIKTPKEATWAKHSYHLYVVLVEQRMELYNFLRSKNIFTQVHYLPIHLQPYYQRLGFKRGDYPVSEAYYERCLSLPMFPTLTTSEQDYVIEQVLEFYK